MQFIVINWAAVIAISAVGVSIYSAWISYRTFKLQRIHNIKSVKPIIHIGQWDYEDRLYVTLKNVGSGIAVVKKLSVENQLGESRTSLYSWFPKKLPGKMNYKEYWTPYTEFVVQPSQEIMLIYIPIDILSKKQIKKREEFRAILKDLKVIVEYEDIYENKMPSKEKHLIHFARTDNVN